MFTVYDKASGRVLETLKTLDMDNLPIGENTIEVATVVNDREYRFLGLTYENGKLVSSYFVVAIFREFGWTLTKPESFRHLPLELALATLLITLAFDRIDVDSKGFLNGKDNRVQDYTSILDTHLISGSGLSCAAWIMEDCGFKFWPLERDSFGWLIGAMRFPTKQKLAFG